MAILGVGLIGGSVARAVRAHDEHRDSRIVLAAWTPGGAGPEAARRDGAIDVAAATPQAAMEGADLIVLAAPVPACLAMLDDLAGPWRAVLAPDAIITDVASTKSAMVLRATALGLRFVGGHPMAGRESSGYAASSADLFVDRPWVVVPSADEPAVVRVEALAVAVGARPVRMSATAHDWAVAGISHLPLVASVALVEAVAGWPDAPRQGWDAARTVASSGWRDATRLALGDVDMGAGIITTNAAPLADRVRELIAALEGFADELERPGGPDRDAISGRLVRARAVLEATGR